MQLSEGNPLPNAAKVRRSSYTPSTVPKLDFLWLELTNRCNLTCVHCYTESHPHSGGSDVLTTKNYEDLMRQAYDLGCRKLQFIGGQPQINRDFYSLLVTSKVIGFPFVEVFTNLTRLDEKTLSFAAANNVCFATSVYSDNAATHDAITQTRGSHARTVGNLKRLIDRGISTRAGVVVMERNATEIKSTKAYLEDLGVRSVRASRIREFGRAEDELGKAPQLSSLCGRCWEGKLSIAPDGEAYPCVMARHWSVGNVLDQSLAEIVNARHLENTRTAIYDAAFLPRISAQNCDPNVPPDPCDPGPEKEIERDCPQTECVPPSCLMDCEPDCAQSCEPNPTVEAP
jgi:MoaA/NifB/PqqE/SkfB family radical SAM enzyme